MRLARIIPILICLSMGFGESFGPELGAIIFDSFSRLYLTLPLCLIFHCRNRKDNYNQHAIGRYVRHNLTGAALLIEKRSLDENGTVHVNSYIPPKVMKSPNMLRLSMVCDGKRWTAATAVSGSIQSSAPLDFFAIAKSIRVLIYKRLRRMCPKCSLVCSCEIPTSEQLNSSPMHHLGDCFGKARAYAFAAESRRLFQAAGSKASAYTLGSGDRSARHRGEMHASGELLCRFNYSMQSSHHPNSLLLARKTVEFLQSCGVRLCLQEISPRWTHVGTSALETLIERADSKGAAHSAYRQPGEASTALVRRNRGSLHLNDAESSVGRTQETAVVGASLNRSVLLGPLGLDLIDADEFKNEDDGFSTILDELRETKE